MLLIAYVPFKLYRAFGEKKETFCGCSLAVSSTGPRGFMFFVFFFFFCREHAKAQPAVVLVQKVPETGPQR